MVSLRDNGNPSGKIGDFATSPYRGGKGAHLLFSLILLHFAGNYGIVVMALPVTVGGWPPFCGGSFLAPDFTEGGDCMVTYSELFQFVMMLTAVIALILQVCNYKKK